MKSVVALLSCGLFGSLACELQESIVGAIKLGPSKTRVIFVVGVFLRRETEKIHLFYAQVLGALQLQKREKRFLFCRLFMVSTCDLRCSGGVEYKVREGIKSTF